MKKTNRKVLLLAAKIAVAAGLLAWVLGGVHWHDYVRARRGGKTYTVIAPPAEADGPRTIRVREGTLWWAREQTRAMAEFEPPPSGTGIIRPGFLTSLVGLNVPLAVLASMGFGASMVLIAIRWWLLLRIQDIRIGLWEAIKLTFLGQFFHAVVPGTVGGDLVKAYYVAKQTHKKAAALVSIFVDRLMGLAELALMAAGMLLVVLAGGLERFDDVRLPAVCLAIILVAVAGLLTFLLSRRFRRAFRLEKLYQRLPIAHHVAAAGVAAELYRRRLGTLAKTVLISFVSHLAFVGFIALTGTSLSLQTPWYRYFVYIPLIYIIGAIPLTPGGVGWVENWYVRFFESPLCGASAILVLAMLARLVPLLWGLPGAVVAVTGTRPPQAESMQAELADGEPAD